MKPASEKDAKASGTLYISKLRGKKKKTVEKKSKYWGVALPDSKTKIENINIANSMAHEQMDKPRNTAES